MSGGRMGGGGGGGCNGFFILPYLCLLNVKYF